MQALPRSRIHSIRRKDSSVWCMLCQEPLCAAFCLHLRQARPFCGGCPPCNREKYMARLARVIGLDLPHHVTQRGNGRRFILDNDTHRNIYFDLLAQSLELHGVLLIGYCLMSKHVHLVLIPRKPESMGLALKHAHGRFAAYW